MPGKCLFSQLWLQQEQYKQWLAPSKDNHKAKCKICMRDIDVAMMGESALKAHMKGLKHITLMKQRGSMLNFLKPTTGTLQSVSNSLSVSKDSPSTLETHQSSSSPSLPNMKSYLSGNECLKAEVMWAMKCCESNYSFNSCTTISSLFVNMFPDSEIAKHFTCGEKKCAYLLCFGVAPHFKQILFKCLDDVDEYTLLFDETLNTSIQTKQMDIFVRFWNTDLNQVHTRYFTSTFMGHATAEDIYRSFMAAVESIKLQKLLQLSMDGPAVNQKFFKMLQQNMKHDHEKKLLELGSCGLHTLHNSFKKGASASGWEIELFLKSLYYLFHDSPAKIETYMELSNSKKVGLKFCHHRWLENLPSALRALEILDDISLFVINVEKGKIAKPVSNSYKVVSSAVKDKLLKVKLQFFVAVAQIVQPFLTLYQSDKPLLPFFANDLTKLVNHCLLNFNILKKEEVKKIDSPAKLAVYQLESSSLNGVSKISFGFIGDKTLSEMVKEKNIPEKDVLALKHEAQLFILKMIKSILEKSPLQYSFVRNSACLDPKAIIENIDGCKKKMKAILNCLVESGHILAEDCDSLLLEFGDFLQKVPREECRKFDVKGSRLDDFLYKNMYSEGFKEIWKICKKVLICSHGQATVESGFSVNKALEVENLKERSYIALRHIKDHLKLCGGVENVQITKELLLSASSARKKYMAYLDEQKEAQKTKILSEKKRKMQEELEGLKQKRMHLDSDISSLYKSADELSEVAEKTRIISYCSQSNALRKKAHEKKEEMKLLNSQIKEKTDELKNML